MSSSKYASMIDLLSTRTIRGEVNWQPTSSKYEFIVYVEGYSIAVADASYLEEATDEVVPVYKIILRDARGNEIDAIYYRPNEEHWDNVEKLYFNARRKALNIDKAVDVILAELSKKGGVGLSASSTNDSDGPSGDGADIPF